jgi:hypothetical protein
MAVMAWYLVQYMSHQNLRPATVVAVLVHLDCDDILMLLEIMAMLMLLRLWLLLQYALR